MTTTINNAQNVNIYNNTIIPSKICIKCNQIKPLSEYGKHKLTSDGLQNNCKLCQSILSKHYWDNYKQINVNKIYNENDVKICSNCKQQKLYTEFYTNATKLLGLETYCKQCVFNFCEHSFQYQLHQKNMTLQN